MSIITSFDADSPAIIDPQQVYSPVPGFPETFVVVFSQKMADTLLGTVEAEQIGQLTAGRAIPLYAFEYAGRKIGFYNTLLGGAGAAALLEETIAMGGRKFLYFGSCGSLDKSVTAGQLLIPEAAYRDEGVSYHYLPASDWVDIPTASRLAGIFEELHLPCKLVKTWTTDSFYRETQKNAALRRDAGCACVEMECASVMAVGAFRHAEVYQFLWAADCLDGGTWDERILGRMPGDMRSRIIKAALETAVRL